MTITPPKHFQPMPLRTAELQTIAEAWDEQHERERSSGTHKYRRKGGGNMLEQLKRFDPEAGDLEEAIALAGFADIFQNQYAKRSLEIPNWLKEKSEALDREIHKRHRDYLEKELKAEETRLETLKTAQEKREDAKQRIDRIRAALGRTQPAPGAPDPTT